MSLVRFLYSSVHPSSNKSSQSGSVYENWDSSGKHQCSLMANLSPRACGHATVAWKPFSVSLSHNKQQSSISIFLMNLLCLVGSPSLHNFQVNTFTFGGTPP